MNQQNTPGPRPKPVKMPDLYPADCEYASRVSAYHDGEMSEVEAREVSRHLSGCQACAAQLAFFGKVSNTFESAPAHHLDADARQRLDDLGEQFHAARRQIRPSADVRWIRRLSAAAAIIFVFAAGKVVYDQRLAGNTPVTPVEQLHKPIGPVPRPIFEDRPSGSPSVSPDGKGSAIMDTDFTARRAALQTPATKQALKP
jgi:hypothetical protein